MKKLLTGLMAVVMMAGLAGCGSKDDGAGEGSDTAKKELTVYTNSGYKPYEMVDEKGNLYGFDIDVMNEAAKLAGYTVKWEDVDFDGIVPSVKQGKADIGIAGITYTEERAKQVEVIEAHGKKYGFIAVSRVIPTADWKVENAVPGLFSCYDTTALVEVIKEAKETCDYVAVYPHWGVEYQAYPEANQTQIAKACIDAGADVVVGSHTHCLQGVSYIEGKPVFYSLGNFIFGQSIDRSAMLEVTIDAAGRASYRFVPVYAAGGVTYPAEGGQAESVLNYLDGISEAAVASDGTVTED